MNPNCGIYQILNITNGKRYIGQSINLKNRLSTHLSHLRLNRDVCRAIQNAFNKYGEDNFKFSVLLFCEESELTRYESNISDYYKSKKLSYNIRECVESNKGIKFSDDIKRKISLSRLGMKFSKEHRKHIGDSKRGNNSPIYGKKRPPHVIEAIKNSKIGKPRSEEVKEKIRQSLLGRRRPDDVRKKISQSMSGKSKSDETKKKMASAQRKRFVSKERLP